LIPLCLIALAPSCGGGRSASVIARAADETLQAGSEQFALDATVRTAEDTARLRGSGAFDSRTRQGSFRLALSATTAALNVGPSTTSFQGVFDREVLWLGSADPSDDVVNGKHWLRFDRRWGLSQAGADLAALAGRTPADLLARVRLTSSSVTTVGKERVNGVEATHYQAPIDSSEDPAGNEILQEMDPKYLPADVWVDGRGLVRKVKLQYSVAFGNPNDGTRARIALTMRFTKFGTRVSAEPPPATDSLDANRYGGN
jgi:hypothetical protein